MLVLALGANDGLRGITVGSSEENLEKVIKTAKKEKIKVFLAGMQLPPNYGEDYRNRFSKMYSELAKAHQLILIPFLLKGVAGESEFNQADGIHPNELGHQKIADLLVPYLLKEW